MTSSWPFSRVRVWSRSSILSARPTIWLWVSAGWTTTGLAGLAALEDDRPQLLHRLFHAVEPLGRVLVEGRFVERRLGERRDRRRRRRPAAARTAASRCFSRSVHLGVYRAPSVIAVWALRLWAHASSPVPGSMGCSLP